MGENIFGDLFAGLDHNSIQIRQYDLDCFFNGTSSKRVFERVSDGGAFFLPEQEAFCFINYHMREWLHNLFQINYKYLVFMTFEVEFVKILDKSQSMTILSSFRNRSWLIPSNLNSNYITQIVDELLSGFTQQYVDDVENLELRTESGN